MFVYQRVRLYPHPKSPFIVVKSHETTIFPNYGQSPFSMVKSTISMAIFNSNLLVYQRLPNIHHNLQQVIPIPSWPSWPSPWHLGMLTPPVHLCSDPRRHRRGAAVVPYPRRKRCAGGAVDLLRLAGMIQARLETEETTRNIQKLHSLYL